MTPSGRLWRAARADHYQARAAKNVTKGAKGLSWLTIGIESLRLLLELLWWYNMVCGQALFLQCAITISTTRMCSRVSSIDVLVPAPAHSTAQVPAQELTPRELSSFS